MENKIIDLRNGFNFNKVIMVNEEIGSKLVERPDIKGMFVFEEGGKYVAVFNDGETNWVEDATTLELACDWLKGNIDGIELNEKNMEAAKMGNKKITILNIEETQYEDNTYWVEYLIGTGDISALEIIEGEEDEIQEKLFGLGQERLTNKIKLEECSEKMQEIITRCLMSDNDTWFVEEDDITKKELEELEEEICELGLNDCMLIYEEEITPITIYGETVTRFLY